FGFELWRTQTYRGSTFHDESVSNVRLELVVDDSDADDVVNVIRQAAMSTSSGTGKIW
ncbi:P-II family nitrogen regulator, partial [Frankia sp. EI5c]|uniref:P-II family nitrogen regulator n=1 Tax=Frankia sp. EI5c TaxID=683316 RepID=UPI0026F44484